MALNKGEEGLEIEFTHTLKSTFAKNDRLLVAYIYPFTFNDALFSI